MKATQLRKTARVATIFQAIALNMEKIQITGATMKIRRIWNFVLSDRVKLFILLMVKREFHLVQGFLYAGGLAKSYMHDGNHGEGQECGRG